jgi:lysophospholipase L1-like esterase
MRALVILCSLATIAIAASDTIDVVNEGHPGWNSKQLRALFKNDWIRPGDSFVLYCGMNDAVNSKALIPLDQYTENVQFMVDAARKAEAGNIVLVTPNPVIKAYVEARHPTHPAKDIPAHLALYDAALRKLAKDNGVLVADFHAAIDSRGGATTDKACLLRNEANSGKNDGVHPTPAGYKLLAETVYGVLKGRVKDGQRVFCLGDSITYSQFAKGAGTTTGETYPAVLKTLLNADAKK